MSGYLHFKLQLASLPEPARGFIALYEKLCQGYSWQVGAGSCSRMVYHEPPPYQPHLGGWLQHAIPAEEQKRHFSVAQAIRAYTWVAFASTIQIGSVGVFCDVECLPEKEKGAVEIFLNATSKSDEILDYTPVSAKERRGKSSRGEKRSALLRFCLDMALAADASGFALFHLDDAPRPIVTTVDFLREMLKPADLRLVYDELVARIEQEPGLQADLEEVLEALTAPAAQDRLRQASLRGMKISRLPAAASQYPQGNIVSHGYMVVSYL